MKQKIKMQKIYICECNHEFKVKSILTAKMNYCYECGREIDKDKVNSLLEEYNSEKKSQT